MEPITAQPAVPLTIEGASVLHQIFRLRMPEWRKVDSAERKEIADEAAELFTGMPRSALFSLLGHKGDLLLLHFRDAFDQLKQAELCVSRIRLHDYLEATSSYLSVVELGLYESSVKTYGALAAKGLEPHSEPWNKEVEEVLAIQRKAMHSRLYPEIPGARYLCFYPMDRRRGEHKNWYVESMEERRRMMEEHGKIGRRYAGQVKQIITGSIGFDDWEWGVDLFADDPLVFKRLIYEMRFDEVSAVYALFGTFFVGLRLNPEDLVSVLDGTLPAV